MQKQPKLSDQPCPFCKEPVNADAIRCPHCQADYTPEQVHERKKAANTNSRNAGIGCLALVILMFFFVSTCGGDDTTDDRKEGTVFASNAHISEVNVTKETKFASIKIDLNESWSASDLPVQAAMVVKDAGKAIKEGVSDIPPEIETINFWFTGPTVDPYGNESRNSLIQFRVKIEDLKLVNYDNIAPQNLLEFAHDIEVRTPARAGVSEYCTENIRTNPRFCVGR